MLVYRHPHSRALNRISPRRESKLPATATSQPWRPRNALRFETPTNASEILYHPRRFILLKQIFLLGGWWVVVVVVGGSDVKMGCTIYWKNFFPTSYLHVVRLLTYYVIHT